MATDIFFRLGDKIKGESIDEGKDGNGKPLKDQIDVLAWHWSLNQSGTTHTGTGGGSGKVSVGDLTITTYVDMASNDIIKTLCSGEHIPQATLSVRKAGGSKPVVYYTIDFEDLIVSSYSTGGGGDGLDRLQETLTINFARFKIAYIRQNEKGGEAGKSMAGWNIPKNTAWS
jgi:type VI secretion system secreted protein Hcp